MMMKVLACGTIMTDILSVGLERIAEPGEIVYLEREAEARIGGHPIDVGIDLVKLGFNPREVGVIAAVGTGLFGNYVKKIIKRYKIRAFWQEIEKIDTGKNIVLEKKGEDRRFHIDPGANWYLDPEFVKSQIKEHSPKIFCVRPGYSGIDLYLEEIFREVKAQNSFLFLDIMEFHPARPREILLPFFHYADAVHCNEKEIMVNTGKENPEEALREILRRGVKVIFLTRGERGAEILTRDFRISQPKFDVEAVDTTGCGDAFCAGVVYKLIEYNEFNDVRNLPQEKLTDLLTFAQAVGASAATVAGCVEGVSKDKVEQILKGQKERILNQTIIKSGC
jgi:sugar/nucleoside kinase (ribokinase family)